MDAIYIKDDNFKGEAGTVFLADQRDRSEIVFFIHGCGDPILCNVNDVFVATCDRKELNSYRR